MVRCPLSVGRVVWMLLGAAGMLLTGTVAGPAAGLPDRPDALKIGLLMDFQQRLDRSRQGQVAGV